MPKQRELAACDTHTKALLMRPMVTRWCWRRTQRCKRITRFVCPIIN